MKTPIAISGQQSAVSDRLGRLQADNRKPVTAAGFTLLEMLAAMTITAILVLLLTAAFNQASRSWLQSENRIETYTQARMALELMTKKLSQAIISPQYSFLGTSNAVAFVSVDEVNILRTLVLQENLFTVYPAMTNSNTLYTLRIYRSFFRYQNFPTGQPEGYRDVNASWDVNKNWGLTGHDRNWVSPNWPCTMANQPVGGTSFDNTLILANLLSLQFDYFYTNAVTGTGSSTPVWNSTALTIPACCTNCVAGPGPLNPGPPSGQPLNTLPYGVLITLTTVDRRAAERLRGLTVNDPAFHNITNQSARTFSAFALINYQKDSP